MRFPLIIGHRGFPHAHPDNSLDGIRAALDLGADGVEIDIRPCRGGEWVVHHDLHRGGTPMLEWTLAGAASVGVPALAAAVELVPRDRWLYVEIKPLARAELIERVTKLRSLLLPRTAFTRVISQSRSVLDVVAREIPEVGRSWVFSTLDDRLPDGAELSPHHILVESLLDSGRPLHPWTVNRRERMAALAQLGVGSITTNRTDLAVEVLHG